MPLWPFARLERWAAPAPEAGRIAFLTAQPFAHRGLHSRIRVENSRSAFRAAVAAGHGIELDVQAASGGEAFVFHDPDLDRLTPARGPFHARTADELDTIPLAGTGETIPRLDEVLRLIAGRVPVLIEVKSPRQRRTALCLTVRRATEGYLGDVGIMSFDPRIGAWFAEHSPRTVRGLVISDQAQDTRIGNAVRRLSAMRLAKPDFLAYDVRDLPSPTTQAARQRGMPVLTWTVRDTADAQVAAEYADQPIYEIAE